MLQAGPTSALRSELPLSFGPGGRWTQSGEWLDELLALCRTGRRMQILHNKPHGGDADAMNQARRLRCMAIPSIMKDMADRMEVLANEIKDRKSKRLNSSH